jgi:DnaK suppressor protein
LPLFAAVRPFSEIAAGADPTHNLQPPGHARIDSKNGAATDDRPDTPPLTSHQHGDVMNADRYRQRLLDQERESVARIERAMGAAREPGDGAAHDSGDESVIDEAKDSEFATADADRTVLTQVRDALARIEDGTFGTCTVDGGPIEAARLEAIPWTPYCLKHQEELDARSGQRTPTL